jgi:hypothetical protein
MLLSVLFFGVCYIIGAVTYFLCLGLSETSPLLMSFVISLFWGYLRHHLLDEFRYFPVFGVVCNMTFLLSFVIFLFLDCLKHYLFIECWLLCVLFTIGGN